jgi:hypothetical protein
MREKPANFRYISSLSQRDCVYEEKSKHPSKIIGSIIPGPLKTKKTKSQSVFQGGYRFRKTFFDHFSSPIGENTPTVADGRVGLSWIENFQAWKVARDRLGSFVENEKRNSTHTSKKTEWRFNHSHENIYTQSQ